MCLQKCIIPLTIALVAFGLNFTDHGVHQISSSFSDFCSSPWTHADQPRTSNYAKTLWNRTISSFVEASVRLLYLWPHPTRICKESLLPCQSLQLYWATGAFFIFYLNLIYTGKQLRTFSALSLKSLDKSLPAEPNALLEFWGSQEEKKHRFLISPFVIPQRATFLCAFLCL